MGNSRILIVDDEIIIARELEARLASMGYEIAGIASSGREALSLAAEQVPDLVLMDIVLKGEMDGIEAAAEIRHRHQVPVIYVTAYTDEKTLSRAKVTEPFGYIVKPFSERELKANIEIALYKDRTDRTLRKIEKWFLKALDHVDDGVVAADRNGFITAFNHGAAAVTAWPKHEAMKRRIDEVVRLLDSPGGKALVLSEYGTEPVIDIDGDTVLVDRNDNIVPIDSTTIFLRDESDAPAGVVNVLRDASGQRRGALAAFNSDVALAASQGVSLEGMLQLCTESMVRNLHVIHASVWIVTQDGKHLVRRATSGQTVLSPPGIEKIDVATHPIGRMYAGELPRIDNAVDVEWLTDGRITAYAGVPLISTGPPLGVLTAFSYEPFSAAAASALETACHSIALGVERRQLDAQLQHAQRLDAIGRLAGGIAHDFNNILTIVMGCASALAEHDNADEYTRKSANEISAASARAAALTRQLLAFSRRQVLEPVAVDLNELIRELTGMLQRLIGEDVRLDTHLEENLPKVRGDRSQLEQVLANLAVNARDAMPTGGRLQIATRAACTADAAHIEDGESIENYVVLLVTDDGSGMTPEVRERAFEPFFTTKDLYEGTGLGLSTVYGIVTQSQGAIAIDSEPGSGTTVTILLPRHKNGTGAVVPAPAQRKIESTGSETILVVEDDDQVRGIVARVLSEAGFRVIAAGNAHEAVAAAREEAQIDLLVTDVVMPEVSGRELAERLQQTIPNLKVLYMSGYTNDAVVRHGITANEVDLLQKPFTPAVLSETVRRVIEGRGKATS